MQQSAESLHMDVPQYRIGSCAVDMAEIHGHNSSLQPMATGVSKRTKMLMATGIVAVLAVAGIATGTALGSKGTGSDAPAAVIEVSNGMSFQLTNGMAGDAPPIPSMATEPPLSAPEAAPTYSTPLGPLDPSIQKAVAANGQFYCPFAQFDYLQRFQTLPTRQMERAATAFDCLALCNQFETVAGEPCAAAVWLDRDEDRQNCFLKAGLQTPAGFEMPVAVPYVEPGPPRTIYFKAACEEVTWTRNGAVVTTFDGVPPTLPPRSAMLDRPVFSPAPPAGGLMAGPNTGGVLTMLAAPVQPLFNGKWPVCAWGGDEAVSWGPVDPEGKWDNKPCGVILAKDGTVSVGEYFGGFDGYFSTDPGDGHEDCFAAAVAGLLGETLCDKTVSVAMQPDEDGVMEEVEMVTCEEPAADAARQTCVCVGRMVDEQKGWFGNVGVAQFLAEALKRANPVNLDIAIPEEEAAAENGARMDNAALVEQAMTDMVVVVDCAGEAAADAMVTEGDDADLTGTEVTQTNEEDEDSARGDESDIVDDSDNSDDADDGNDNVEEDTTEED